MNDHAHFIQQHTSRYLENQKRAWDLFLYWMDQADDDVMTVHKKQEFLDCLQEDRDGQSPPIHLPFKTATNSSRSPTQDARPQCG